MSKIMPSALSSKLKNMQNKMDTLQKEVDKEKPDTGKIKKLVEEISETDIASTPSAPAILPLAVDGDMLVGFDLHTVPGSPSPVPFPFIGTLNVSKGIVSVDGKKVAYKGLKVKSTVPHGIPPQPATATLKKKNHNKDITTPEGDVIASGPVEVSCCGTVGQYVIIPKQFLTFL